MDGDDMQDVAHDGTASEDVRMYQDTPAVITAATGDSEGADAYIQEAAVSYFAHAPGSRARLLFHADKEFLQHQQQQQQRGLSASPLFNNFTKGVQVSPDGLCMLTNSEDHVLRLFEMHDDDGASDTTTSDTVRPTLQIMATG